MSAEKMPALLIFGGARKNSVGWAIVEKFIAGGWDVYLCDLGPANFDVQLCDAALHLIDCDLRVGSQITSAVNEVCDRTGKNLCGMIYAAGFNRINAVADYRIVDWEDTLRLNLTSPFLCMQALAKRNPVSPSGEPFIYQILGSNTSYVAKTKSAAYGASKAGVVQMAACMHRELAPAGYRVTVLNFGPVFDTDMDRNTQEELYKQRGWERGEYMREIVRNIPIKRFTFPGEIAMVCWFLATEPVGELFGGRAINFDGGQQQG